MWRRETLSQLQIRIVGARGEEAGVCRCTLGERRVKVGMDMIGGDRLDVGLRFGGIPVMRHSAGVLAQLERAPVLRQRSVVLQGATAN
jgi:hypothetical protein